MSQIFSGCNSANAFNNTTITEENSAYVAVSVVVIRTISALVQLLDFLMSLFELKMIPDYLPKKPQNNQQTKNPHYQKE